MGCYESVPEPAAMLGMLAVFAVCKLRCMIRKEEK